MEGSKLLCPAAPCEFVQLCNRGTPIELEKGSLVLTHGVGSVRNYRMGACLRDRDAPSRALRRLRTLLVLYGVADNFATFATVPADALLSAMTPVEESEANRLVAA